MSKITNEAILKSIETIFNSVQGLIKTTQGLTKTTQGLTKTVNGMLYELVGLKEWTKEKDIVIEKLCNDVSFIKTIVEKDATKQKNHEAEHAANVSAHDRFETRIKVLEKAKK